jgi:hypothetical protein
VPSLWELKLTVGHSLHTKQKNPNNFTNGGETSKVRPKCKEQVIVDQLFNNITLNLLHHLVAKTGSGSFF